MQTNVYLLVFAFVSASLTLTAQDEETLVTYESEVETEEHNEKAKTIKEWFQLGHVNGLIRSNAMITINDAQLSDHGAWAVGGRLYYHTAYLKGFQIGLGGLYIYNLASTNLAEPDPELNKLARWERQLFDITDPENKNDLDRLEELYIKYKHLDLSITAGKMLINTPLVNPQDSRMKPTVVNGIWTNYMKANWSLQAGWFNKISPRSTTEWFDLEEAIGLYNNGVNMDGTPSEYKENIKTPGLLIVGGHIKPHQNLKINAWNYTISNILNAAYLETTWNKDYWGWGIQMLNEAQTGNGGSSIESQQYYQNKNPFNLVSGKIEWKSNVVSLSYNSTWSIGDGRFTFPRELGTIRLYSYIPRHRVEGLGKFNTQTIKLHVFPVRNSNRLDVGFAFARTNTNIDPAYNKYGFISYNQINFSTQYKFKNHLEGLELKFLSVADFSGHASDTNPKDYIFNKTNLLHFNIVANYSF